MEMTTSSMSMMNTTSMTLFFSTTTPLYSMAWAPTNSGQYAGTCIFVALLAIAFRALLAAKAIKEEAWLVAETKRRYVTVVDKPRKAESIASDASAENLVLSKNGVEENVVVVKQKGGKGARPWRVSVDPVRAAIDTVIAGVGYLLMLAVMTMNAGYFLSILAGTFVGSLAVGRYITLEH